MKNEKSNNIGKSRNWVGVLYIENMIENWENKISDIVQVPFCYCIHDKDLDKEKENRKKHVHLILTFPNTTTYNHAFNVFKLLSKENEKAVNKIEAIINIRSKYEYLIHNTPGSKDKYQYSKLERISGNGFDIGFFEQLSTQDKEKITLEIARIIKEYRIINFLDLFEILQDNFDSTYLHVFQTRTNFFDKLLKGSYQREYLREIGWHQKNRNINIENKKENQ